MPENESNIEIRSDEVQEILSHTPSWMIRWGITSIFLLLLILIGISFFVKYPDVIQGQITLTTEIPPVKLVSKTNGQLTAIYVKEGQVVNANDFIADIESPLTDTAVNYLKGLVFSIKASIDNPQKVKVNFEENTLVFGDIQTEYGQLKKTYSEYYVFSTDSYNKKKINNLKEQISFYKNLAKINQRQIKLTKENLKNAQVKFNAELFLYEKGAISKMEFLSEQTTLNQTKKEVENLNKNIIQNQIIISQNKKELYELEYQMSEKERTLKESINISCNAIENYLNTWKQNYRVTAPFDGTISYLTILNKNQFVNAGTNLFAVVPNNNEYIGTVQIPTQGFGKVEIGQTVYIKLSNYPSNEFGQLEGVIKDISLIPSAIGEQKQAMYLAKVSLKNGLTTTYKRELSFQPEMGGMAEIVTQDLRLIERIFSQFRKLMD